MVVARHGCRGLRPMRTVSLCSKARALRAKERGPCRNQYVGSANELDVQRCIQHVGRGHALVDEAAVGTDEFREMSSGRQSVMLGDGFDLIDAATLNSAAPPFSQMVLAASFGMTPRICQCVAGIGLDFETRCGTSFQETRWRPFRGASSGDHGLYFLENR